MPTSNWFWHRTRWLVHFTAHLAEDVVSVEIDPLGDHLAGFLIRVERDEAAYLKPYPPSGGRNAQELTLVRALERRLKRHKADRMNLTGYYSYEIGEALLKAVVEFHNLVDARHVSIVIDIEVWIVALDEGRGDLVPFLLDLQPKVLSNSGLLKLDELLSRFLLLLHFYRPFYLVCFSNEMPHHLLNTPVLLSHLLVP